MKLFNLYPCFKWPGNVYIISDPHFADEEMLYIRKNYIGDELLVKRINSRVTKDDTLVILGDVGDVNYVKKLNGYKILIMGNHDKGAINYQRNNRLIPYCVNMSSPDNNLFDEVYKGCLMINEKILLSHEPVDFKYAFNLHGHDHNGSDFIKYVLKSYDADMDTSDILNNYLNIVKEEKLNKLNLCAEWLNYYPFNLNYLYKKGIIHHIEDIHRVTIDKANENKKGEE